MTSKEKYLLKIAGRESEAVKLAKERIKNRQWLKESQLLAVRILMRLDELGLNQKDLAERLGVTAQYVSKLLKGKEKGQIVDAIVCYFQVNDKTPYGMEYLSKLDNAIGDAEDYYNKTYTEEKSKSFTDGINDFKEKHGAIFQNKSYEELKNNFITVGKLLEDYIEESGYGMDMWSKEENDTMSKIIQILKQNKIIQDESE